MESTIVVNTGAAIMVGSTFIFVANIGSNAPNIFDRTIVINSESDTTNAIIISFGCYTPVTLFSKTKPKVDY